MSVGVFGTGLASRAAFGVGQQAVHQFAQQGLLGRAQPRPGLWVGNGRGLGEGEAGGGQGDDTIWGGTGDDVYRFARGDGRDQRRIQATRQQDYGASA